MRARPRIAIVTVDGFKHLLLVYGFGLAASGRDVEGRPQSALAASVLTFAGQSETRGRSCGHRQLVGSGQPDLGGQKMSLGFTLHDAADFCPNVESSAPGSSQLRGSNMITTEVKLVVDLIVS